MTYGMILSEATVCAVVFFVERGIFMARKSRKYQHAEIVKTSITKAVGYVRLSVANQEESSSIQNQKFIIERWGDQHQIPISHYYIDNGFSGKQFDRPAFQKMIENKIPASVSNTAGTFVCNHVCYGMAHLASTKYPNMRTGFVHIPFLPEQVVDKRNMPSMPLEMIAKGLEYAIEAIVENKEDIKVEGGATH